MPVESKHPDFAAVEKDYQLIADCLAGQRAIKKKRTEYLPKPNKSDASAENSARYEAYLQRAIFHGATARTQGNLVGQCFAIDPVATIPDAMQPWLNDVDGGGVSAIQQSKKALGFVTGFSRAFLWVDYPRTNGAVSIAEMEAQNIRPKLILCGPEDVINWRVESEGAKTKLALVVIRERVVSSDDGFEAKLETQYRVLKLVGGVYVQEIYRKDAAPLERITPQNGKGEPFNYIPGVFIGAESNSPDVEKPLLLDIANLNLAHYRNSADYEELTFMLGQPTPYITGLSDAWIERQMKGQIMLGSRACIPLPEGGSAGLLQIAPNPEPKAAMEQKEALMMALGAKLVEKRQVQQTATEAGISEASESSILASCCKNVSAAYAFAFRAAADFANIEVADPDKEILFELNTDFAIARMTPEEAQGVLSLYQANLITFEEARDKLKTGGWAYLDDEDAKDQLDQQAQDDFAKAQAELKAQTDQQMRLQQQKQQQPAPTV
jgi:hypothetical protein